MRMKEIVKERVLTMRKRVGRRRLGKKRIGKRKGKKMREKRKGREMGRTGKRVMLDRVKGSMRMGTGWLPPAETEVCWRCGLGGPRWDLMMKMNEMMIEMMMMCLRWRQTPGTLPSMPPCMVSNLLLLLRRIHLRGELMKMRTRKTKKEWKWVHVDVVDLVELGKNREGKELQQELERKEVGRDPTA